MTDTASFIGKLLPPERYEDTDQLRRARVLGMVASLVCLVGTLRGSLFFLTGDVHASITLYAAASVSGLVLYGVRRGDSLRITGNLMSTVMFATCCITSISRGGIGTPVLAGLGMVPLLVTLVAGWRSGLLWMVLGVAAILLIAGDVVGLPGDRIPEQMQFRLDLAATLSILVVMSVIGVTYEWAKREALAEREVAEHARLLAVEDARLLRADRLSSMGILAAGIGHEINNPLSYVLANLEFSLEALPSLAKEDHPERQEVEDVLTEALSGVHRIRLIVRDLRSFAQTNHDNTPQRFPVERAMRSALSLTRGQLRQKAQLTLNFADDRFTVVGEEHRLVQVFVNLLLNANHAIQSPQATDSQILVSIERLDSDVLVRVRDTGPGVSTANQLRIFEPFFTTRVQGKGTGLGLSVSLGIIRDMHGAIELESEEGAGATFTVRLPIGAAESDADSEVTDALPEISTCLRILIVDDEKLVGAALARVLDQHSVVVVQSAEAAQQQFLNERFEVVFCDLMMPGTSGIDLYRGVREQRPDQALRFVFITGGVFSEDAQAFITQTDQPLVHKPLMRSTVLSAVVAIIEKSNVS